MATATAPIPEPTKSDKERFFKKVTAPENACHTWQGYVAPDGYGRFAVSSRRCLAHRVAFFLHYGVDPGELLVMHTCDNTICVNPEHLKLGTNDENMADMVSKKRSPFGENSPRAKLKESEVVQIREMRRLGVRISVISRLFKINWNTINQVVNYITWRHIA